MQTSSKAMLVIMGICIGLIFFGINIALIKFNNLVSPEQPLELLNWRTAGDILEISLLGETLQFTMPNSSLLNDSWTEKVRDQVSELYCIGRDEFNQCLAPVMHKYVRPFDDHN